MDQSQLVITAPSLRSGTSQEEKFLQVENVALKREAPPSKVWVRCTFKRAKYFPRNQCYVANREDSASSLERSCEI